MFVQVSSIRSTIVLEWHATDVGCVPLSGVCTIYRRHTVVQLRASVVILRTLIK